jgi:putative peptidoglycan lipid II flippase
VYADLRVRRGAPAVAAFERSVFWTLAAVGGALSLVVFAGAGGLARLTAGGEGGPLQQATEYVLRFAACAIALNVIADYLGYLLALRGRFIPAALALIANALVGALFLVAWPEGRLTNLALGTLLGIAAQLAIVAWSAAAAGFSPFGTGGARTGAERRAMIRLGAWILPGTLCSNLVNSLPPVMLVPFGEGAVSSFGYAYRFHQAAVQLAVTAASPILLSRFSHLVAAGEWERLERIRLYALKASLLLGAAALFVVFFGGESLLVLIFGHGRFDAAAAARVSTHWAWLTLGLSAALYGTVLAKRMQAGRHARALSFIAGASLAAFVITAYALRALAGEYAIPVALVVAATLPVVLMQVFLSQAAGTAGPGAPA